MPQQRMPFHVMTKPIGPICNLDCEYCYYLEKENLYPQGEQFRMSDDLLESYVRQYIAAQPGPEVSFAWQGGEPTLMGLDFFRKAVALQKAHLPSGWTCRNALQTNGTLLTDEWAAFFRENGFLVGISIDGPAELHDVYRYDKGRGPTHAGVMKGLKLLQEHEVEYNVLCVVNRANVEHPITVYRFFREHGVTWLQFIPLVEPVGGEAVSPRTVPAEAYGRFLAAIFDEWVRHDVGHIHVQIFEECLAVWSGLPASLCIFAQTCGRGLAMEHDGELFACDHYVEPAYRLGNLLQTDLIQLVEAPQQAKFGLDKRDTLPRYCRECDVRFMCNGECPKNRILSTPDGEPGLNYLCAGYKHFFHHVDPVVRRMGGLLRGGVPPARVMVELAAEDAARWARAGRNDPCPCGSGKKYKHCCLDRRQAPPGARSG